MILDIDLGNSAGKWRVSQGCDIAAAGRFDYQNLADFFAQLPSAIRRIRIVSVLGEVRQTDIISGLKLTLGLDAEVVQVTASCAGVTNGYVDASCLGADRWMAIVAAWNRLRGACIVVDAGSALTIDCVDQSGVHLGGYILPGISLMRRSLIAGTEKIRVNPSVSSIAPGINTDQAVGHGALLAATASIVEARAIMYKNTGVLPEIILTGGDAALLLSCIGQNILHVPDLVFDGLALALALP